MHLLVINNLAYLYPTIDVGVPSTCLLSARDLLIELVPKRYAHVARRPAGGRAGDEIRGPLTARWPRLISNVLDGRAMRRCRSEPCSLQGARVEDLTKNRRRLAF
ncbi:hypothetical protein MES5069_190105 [Mesorhizobium escarrei]|uniref:Uncharacterized protein n=1 Tax=Mesorhizobium escarrei TaxID=666018 RepID=A0ABN8JKB4_9HYPH|nr:hypothetical protein MES5069_190105 [Mesorhizobium escarrei]